MRKADITLRHYDGAIRPVVNVKVHRSPNEKDFAAIAAESGDANPFFTPAWIDANVSDADRSHAWDEACRDCFELGIEDARTIYGQSIKLYQAGRSGGWVYIDHGMADGYSTYPGDDLTTWDAVAIAKWGKFEKWMRQDADDVPFRYLWFVHEWYFVLWAAAEHQRQALSL